MPGMEGFDPGNMPDMGDFNPGNMPGTKDTASENMSGQKDSGQDEKASASADTFKEGSGQNTADTSEEASEQSASDGGEKSGGMRGGPFMGGNGANLNYSDDDPDSYSTIWDGALTDTSESDHKRVITALKNISEGNDLEKYLNVDNVLKYMAVHAFSVNMDSLSGNMAHNYYLYEYNGRLDIFPWDYNLSFGGMGMGRGTSGGATDMVNDAIDTPFDGTDFFDALLENEEYLERYHEYLRILTEEYVDGGVFDEVYSGIRSRIDELVKTDPTAFYSYDEYNEAAEMLYDVIKLRAESIEGQLDGTIPSTDEGQKNDGSALIDASEIDLSVMGSFNMGGVNEENAGKRRGGRPRGGGGMPFGGMNGMPAQNTGGISPKSLIIYGACLAGMLIMLFSVKKLKRRRI
jgi:hypothetical protein